EEAGGAEGKKEHELYHCAGAGEQQIDEAGGRRLRFVVGKAGSFVRLDEDVVRLRGVSDHEVNADDRYIDRPRSAAGGRGEVGMHGVSDVVDRAAGMEVGGLAHGDLTPLC